MSVAVDLEIVVLLLLLLSFLFCTHETARGRVVIHSTTQVSVQVAYLSCNSFPTRSSNLQAIAPDPTELRTPFRRKSATQTRLADALRALLPAKLFPLPLTLNTVYVSIPASVRDIEAVVKMPSTCADF